MAPADLRRAADSLAGKGEIAQLKGVGWVSTEGLAALAAKARGLVAAHHRAGPLDPSVHFLGFVLWALIFNAVLSGNLSGIYDRYQGAVESFVPLLRAGAPDGPGGQPVPPATDEAVVGGVASLLSRRVIAGESADLTGLLPDVLEFVLTPHLGTEAARRIISAG